MDRPGHAGLPAQWRPERVTSPASRAPCTVCRSVDIALCCGRQPSTSRARVVSITTEMRAVWIQAACEGIAGSRLTISALTSTATDGIDTQFQPSSRARSRMVNSPVAARL